MTSKTDYSPEAWQTLLSTPVTITTYITVADPALFGSIKEAYSAAKTIAKTSQNPDNTELLLTVIAELSDKDMSKQAQPTFDKKDLASMKQQMEDMMRQAVAVLDETATPEEAVQLKNWYYLIGVNAAESSREGGFLGIGSVRVSDAEKGALAELAQIFGIDTSSSPAAEEAPDGSS